jgi:radical SAM family RiPP maturation amino acid epimerase
MLSDPEAAIADDVVSAEPKVPEPTAAGKLYRQILAARSPEELHTLALIKRFLEVWGAEPALREEYAAIANSGGSFAAMQERLAMPIDISQIVPIVVPELAHIRQKPELRDYPLAFKWHHYMREITHQRGLILQAGFTDGHNPAFDAWRTRQVKRLVGEIGPNAISHTHPVIAFELSEGCSVGCWFCGISAEKFRGHWPYAPNQATWRATLDETVKFFGPAATTGFCYWATDPSDNPDYPEFILDYYQRTGGMPQTTTAAPLKNVAQTRKVMDLFNKYRTVTNRFSILNRKYLQRVHDTFTADELLGVELVLQSSGSYAAKSLSGRAIEKAARKPDVTVEDSTIACVTGFLVSMPLGRVQLITPTRATKAVPNGYYILGERHFSTPAEYGEALRDLAAEHISTDMKADDRLMFRPDMEIEFLPDGVTIKDHCWTHSVRGSHGRVIGETIASGEARVSELFGRVADADGDLLRLGASLEKLFNSGVLQEQGMFAHYAPELSAAAAV